MRAGVLVLEGVRASYGAIEALKGITLEVRPGEIVTVIGANGAGKTTMLMTVSGIVRARAGRILHEGEEITSLAPDRIMQRGICHSPEGRKIFPRMTVRENLEMGAFRVRDKRSAAETLERVCALFPRLQERMGQQGGTLSGGEQQMLAIGRALMGRPRLLLLDEPSLGIAPILVQEIFREIRRINAEDGVTILLVEQNANMALHLASRGYVLETGRVVLEDAASALLANPQVKEAYLG
ncbi:MAG: ABC transporter ATP-binding protein [Planctomycetaceae bacterium]